MIKQQLFLPASIVIAALLISGAVIYTKIPQTVSPKESPAKENVKQEVVLNEEGNTLGNEDAKVVIIEFSDFQCPYCQKFHLTAKQIMNDYPETVKLIFKYFPLDQMHPEARPAAEASECASEQGKFWEFTDALFENQASLSKKLYSQLASELSLDVNQFEECLSSRKYKDKVETDYQEGIAAGVRGTPASFVNGQLISGAVPYETLKTAVEKALAESAN